MKQYLTVINENTVYCQFLFLVTPQTPMTTIFLSCFIFMEKCIDTDSRLMENEIPGMDALRQKIYTALILFGIEELGTKPTI